MTDLISQHLDLWTTAIVSKSRAGRGNKSPSPAGEGRGEGNPTSTRNAKYTAYGIKKLRELILELAVRGKLVPQDPNDEPANELLKRIQTNKPKNFSGLSIEEYSYLPPDGWVISRFGDIFSLEYGDNLPAEKRSNTGEYPVYGSNGIVGSHNECFVKSPCIVVGRKGSAGALNLSVTQGCCVTDVAYYCIPPNELDLNYVFKLFQTLRLDFLGKGIKPGLNRNEAYLLQVPIPPLAEQHRIVAKVDELMALCDQLEQQQTDSIAAHQTLVQTLLDALIARDGVYAGNAGAISGNQAADAAEFEQAWSRIADHFDTLFTTEHSIDQLKQTLLQLAVMGKLVPQDPNDEPANLLLLRCSEERALLIKQGKERAQKPLPKIEENEKPWDLPQGWEWERLGNIFCGGSGTTPLRSNTSYFINGSENWFKTTDLNLGIVIEGEEKITKLAIEECNLTYYPPGTVCIAMYGGGGTIGKSGVLGVESTINQSVFALPPVDQVLPNYLHIFVKTVRDKWMQYAAGLRKDPNINGLIIKKMVMPIPPKAEQHRIVAKVDELMAICDTLKARIAAAQTTQIHLADAIVEQAVA